MTETAKVLQFHTRPRKPTRDSKPRQHLWESEIEQMIQVCSGRYVLRNRLLILMMFRHGLRSAEAVSLRWSDINGSDIYIRRVKHSDPAVHPLSTRETAWLGQMPPGALVFTSERGALSTKAIRDIIAVAGRRAGVEFPVSAHMLRHSCGCWLSAQGADLRVIQAYLGHRNIRHTTGYVALSANRFREVYWRD